MTLRLSSRARLWHLCGLGCLLLSLGGCKPAPQSQEATPPATDSTAQVMPLPGDNQTSRGLGMADARLAQFVLADSFPQLARLVQRQPDLTGELTTYARGILAPQTLSSEAGILDLLQQRDEAIIPGLIPLLENDDTWLHSDQGPALIAELSRLGIFVQTAEGMFTGLGPAPVLEDAIARLGSEALQWYLRFQNADAASGAGEYPFLDMTPYRDMVVAGERLQSLSPDTYFPRIEPRFYDALEVFTDLHLVSSPTGRQDQEAMPMTQGVSTDFYPFATELNTHREFVEGTTRSRYREALGKILENPSRITERPEDIYIIVLDWVEQKEAAQQRVRNYLAQGADIPHHLLVRQGDGKDRYCIAYRFYEDADQAQVALDRIQPAYPRAEMIMVSVKGDKLYQLGPG